MQHSKSLVSFASQGENAQLPVRPRARSSLDTFVIPGRTRIPSSKPTPVDIQIAETLLKPAMARPIADSSSETPSTRKKAIEAQRVLDTLGIEAKESCRSHDSRPLLDRSSEHTTASSLNDIDNDNTTRSMYTLHPQSQEHYKVRPEISRCPPPQIGRRDVIVVPPRRRRESGQNTPTKRLGLAPPRKVTPHMQQRRPVYDGAIGSSYESRTTRMTWSTVSHRIFTNSSGSPQGLGALESLEEFNRLAVEFGIPEMERCPGDDFYQKKSTERTHHNWLARKLFHRSSSTYTLKVKSTQKPLKRKKSFGVIPKLEDGSQKNILKDKNLEEVCRLGGTDVLVLPEGFGVNERLSLPTCLSATATYLLQHGVNTPGLFRISGQSYTVNALYEYYAFQFAEAGSPSKVQETVGSGLLPTHVEYTVSDIASLFKKILNALPGGLLGSWELFEAFRCIFFQLKQNPELCDSDFMTLRAKLVALAISSVASTKRGSLIQAVIGLVAYFGNEAEVARKAVSNTIDGAEERQPSSELMGFQSLGVVMGPLLVGSLIDKIDLTAFPDTEDTPRKSIDSGRKADKKTEKKQKRVSVSNKLDRDATLSVHVERANLTANIMELLLTIWKDVVVQLQDLHVNSSTASLPAYNNKRGSSNRQDLGTSEEEILFMNILRGRPLPAKFSGEVKIRKKVKISRSPMARDAHEVSSVTVPESPANTTSGREIPVSESKAISPTAAVRNDTVSDVGESSSSTTGSPNSASPASPAIHADQRSRSEKAMAEMSMGTILPRLQDTPVTPFHREMLRSVSQPPTPKLEPRTPRYWSSSATPETALRDSSMPEVDAPEVAKRSMSSLEKPLPPIGAAQRAELSPPRSEEDSEPQATTQEFPARKSSLVRDQSKQTPTSFRPLELTSPAHSLADPSPSAKQRSRSSTMPISKRTSQPETDQAADGASKFPDRSNRGSVKLLAQRFDGAPRSSPKIGTLDNTVPRVYARIFTLPPSNTAHHDDPFLSSTDTSPEHSPERVSRIPRLGQDAGHVHKSSSRSLSPTKSLKRAPSPPKSPSKSPLTRLPPKAYLKKRPSSFNVVENDAITVQKNSIRGSRTAETMIQFELPDVESNAMSDADPDLVDLRQTQLRDNQDTLDDITASQPSKPSRSPPPPPERASYSASHRRTNSGKCREFAPTRPLSAYSFESLRRMQLLEEPSVAQHIPTRVVSIDINTDQPTRVVEIASTEGSGSLQRTDSMKNNALHAEIARLKRELERREKEVNSTRRSLDAVRDAREETGNAISSEVSGSVGKGTLSNEVRLARKECAEWKRRAEWAEGRLTVVDRKREAERGASTRTSEMSTPRRGISMEERPKEWLHE